MERIDVNPKRRWREYLRAAQVLLERDGAVLLVARDPAAHRTLRRVFHDFLPTPECRQGRITTHIYQDESDAWQLLIAPPGHGFYDAHDGVVEVS